MTQKPIKSLWTFSRAAAIGGAAALLLCRAALGQTIPNPSFEIDAFTNYPGYVSGNFPITGWTAAPGDEVGLNPAAGQSPFADNGAIPDGKNAAFIQSGADTNVTSASLSTTISGLTVGTIYKVTFRANARNGDIPNLRVLIDTNELLAVGIWPSGAPNIAYTPIAFEFTAAKTSQTLTLLNDATSDNTVLVDDFKIAPSNLSWTVAAWTGDTDIGVDSTFFYTHAYSFANSANVTVNGVLFTGIPGVEPQVPGQFYTTNLSNTYGGDTGNAVDQTSTGWGIAQNFDYGGTLPVGDYEAITILGLTPGSQYVATIYSTAWDAASTNILNGTDNRWLTWVAGDDWLTINQDEFDTAGVRNGIRYSYAYTADSTGSVTLKVFPLNNLNQSAHMYAFSNRLAAKQNVAPVITAQPLGTVVSPGLPVTFSVAADGIPAPTYQWRWNGGALPGAQGASFTLTATIVNQGKYDVVVANSAGTVTSAVASLTVGMPVNNPSFEADTFTVYPGYCNTPGDAPITDWTLGSLGGGGLNPAGTSPFADNGAIPNGVNVAFIQGSTYLGQVVSNFTVGSAYVVHYYENARTVTTVPWLEVQVGGSNGVGGLSVLAPHAIIFVGGKNPYHDMYSDVFTATSTDLELDFIKSDPTGGDSSALLDNITILPIAPGTAPFVTPNGNPQPVLVSVGGSASFSGAGVGSPPLGYQWLMNGAPIAGSNQPTLSLSNIQKPADADYSLVISNGSGSATTAVAHLTVYEPIPDLFSTGVDSNHVALAGGVPDPHYRLTVNPDTGPGEAVVEAGIPSSWMANNATAQWIGPQSNTSASAGGRYVYRTVLNLTNRDPSTLIIEGEWASDNEGLSILVNGFSTSNPESLSLSGYTAFSIYGTDTSLNWVAGNNTLDFVMQNDGAGYTGLNVNIIRSNLRIPPGVPPTITTPLVSQTVIAGATVTFTTTVSGSAPQSYQWEKNGAPIPGQTTLTLTLPNVTGADVGSYSLQASNLVGSTNSVPATLTVLQPIPGANPCFGTGLAADGSFLAAGTTDPHYALTYSDDPSYPGPDAVVVNSAWPIQAGVWLLDGPNSQWIAPLADQSSGNFPGAYTYETTFDLTGYDLSKVSVGGGWASDNGGTNVVLNGVGSGLQVAGFSSLIPFVLSSTNGLVAGKNKLDFETYNAGTTINPTGLRVDLWALVAATAPPTLQVSHNGPSLTISWAPADSTHHLQSAPALTGPWTVITGATSPFTTNATAAKVFYSIAP
ncbi:MAG: immunoglobulin domain-containing protein [Verrucomicrobiota bacterium]|jgi:hypothetical protein